MLEFNMKGGNGGEIGEQADRRIEDPRALTSLPGDEGVVEKSRLMISEKAVRRQRD